MTAKERYALILADYVAQFHEVPPSILSEASAADLMLAAPQRDRAIQQGEPLRSAEQRKKGSARSFGAIA